MQHQRYNMRYSCSRGCPTYSKATFKTKPVKQATVEQSIAPFSVSSLLPFLDFAKPNPVPSTSPPAACKPDWINGLVLKGKVYLAAAEINTEPSAAPINTVFLGKLVLGFAVSGFKI